MYLNKMSIGPVHILIWALFAVSCSIKPDILNSKIITEEGVNFGPLLKIEM